MQIIRIYSRRGGCVKSFRPFFVDEKEVQKQFPEGEYLWLR